MNILWAVVLGIVQGFTEFLPVSSSGHLVILQNLVPSFTQPGVVFDVILHLGTMIAVLCFFRKTIFSLFKKYFWLFVIGTIPAGLVGFFFQQQLEGLFGNVKAVGVALLVTAVINFLTDRTITDNKNVTSKNALLIGTAQALAIIPGISRSGATIFAGAKLGINKEKAAEFSFLLSIPAILGANFLQFISHGTDSTFNLSYYFPGFLAALVSGFISISVVLKTLHERKFKIFGYYCLILGILVLFFS